LIHDANALASSQYGRFLANKLDLHLLERRPNEWRVKHLGVTGGKAVPVTAPVQEVRVDESDVVVKKKRDAIDDLFADVEKKPKRSKGSAA
jgi:nucleolar protein 9